MTWSEDELGAALRQALDEFAEERGQDAATAIQPIIFTSLQKGRVAKFLNQNSHITPRGYVWRVAGYYQKLHRYLYELQEMRSAKVWKPLYPKILTLAYRYFLRKGYPPRQTTRERADECAHEAIICIITAHFPYDVDFMPWMCTLLRNVCRNSMNPPPPHIDQDISEIHYLLSEHDSERFYRDERLRVLRDTLLKLIEELPLARQQVILLHYFEGKSFEEIAKILKKTVNAVYQLHFYALRDLKNKWQQDDQQ